MSEKNLGRILLNLLPSREDSFQMWVKDLRKMTKDKGTKNILTEIGKSKNDENRAALMEILFNRLYNPLNLGSKFSPNAGGFDPFHINPNEAFLGDMTTNLGKMFDPGVREFVSPEKAEQDLDPRASNTRDQMSIPKGRLGKRFFDLLHQKRQRTL